MLRARRVAWALLCSVAPSGPCAAMPLLELLGRGADASDRVTSVWLDPARLSPNRAEAEFLWLQTDLSITRDTRPSGYDVPEDVFDARLRTADGTARLELRPLPTSQLARPSGGESKGRRYLVTGLTRQVLDDRLSFGLVAAVPLEFFQVQSPFYADEREQTFSNALHFERFGDRLEGTNVSAALAGRATPWLALAAGLALQTRAVSVANVYLPDPSRPEVAQTNADVRVETTVSPYFGAGFTPFEDRRHRLGLTLHLPSASEVQGRTVIRFWDDADGPSSQRFTFRYADQPLRLTGTLEAALPLELQAHATGRYTRWSVYRDRHDERPEGFEDVAEADLGLRRAFGAQSLGLGALFSPSPMPSQSGRESRVDNDRVGASARWALDVPTPVGHAQFGVGLNTQWLLERSHRKSPSASTPLVDELPEAVNLRTGEPFVGDAGLQTNNPGFPGYASDGFLFAVGVGVTWTR
ncbi:MAG: hypothetical protein ACOYM9_09200 [Bradymonadia bacterium]